MSNNLELRPFYSSPLKREAMRVRYVFTLLDQMSVNDDTRFHESMDCDVLTLLNQIRVSNDQEFDDFI